VIRTRILSGTETTPLIVVACLADVAKPLTSIAPDNLDMSMRLTVQYITFNYQATGNQAIVLFF
jgi:hypothetical protein